MENFHTAKIHIVFGDANRVDEKSVIASEAKQSRNCNDAEGCFSGLPRRYRGSQ
ncbi:MAG: hypothetical protein LBE71_06105 [Dysgonamonadaceae bacterium]|jgi:hypothetical protein|nr:hypothetical protein [Dysgonamonadaceae bacterium]